MLDIGSVVYQRTLKFYPDHPDLTRTQLDFKAKPGKAFALMVLGMVPKERAEGFSPNKQLQQMGWVFLDDEEREKLRTAIGQAFKMLGPVARKMLYEDKP